MTTNTVTFPPYVIHRVLTNVLTRWPCGLCTGHTEKTALIYHYVDADGDQHDVCDECVVDGVGAIPAKMRALAAQFPQYAADLNRDAGQDWEITTDLAEDPQTIMEMVEYGPLAKCPQCDYIGEQFMEWTSDDVWYVGCPKHGKTVL